MFPVFAAHTAPGGALMFTSGPRAGPSIGDGRASDWSTTALIRPNTRSCLPRLASWCVSTFPKTRSVEGRPSGWQLKILARSEPDRRRASSEPLATNASTWLLSIRGAPGQHGAHRSRRLDSVVSGPVCNSNRLTGLS
jgi:hypothetical protein